MWLFVGASPSPGNMSPWNWCFPACSLPVRYAAFYLIAGAICHHDAHSFVRGSCLTRSSLTAQMKNINFDGVHGAALKVHIIGVVVRAVLRAKVAHDQGSS